MTPFGAAVARAAIAATVVVTIATVIAAITAVIPAGMIAAHFAPAKIAAATLDVFNPAASVVVSLGFGSRGEPKGARDQRKSSRKLEYPHRILLQDAGTTQHKPFRFNRLR
jgi:hypothetical protein